MSDVRIDGVSVGEYGINAAIAGDFDVPVTLVTGDDLTIVQVRDLLGEQVAGVQVKRAIATQTAESIHPEVACEMIEAAAREAVTLRDAIQPYRIEDARIEAEFNHQTLADLSAMAPDVERIGERTVAFQAENGVHLVRTWRAMLNRTMTRSAI